MRQLKIGDKITKRDDAALDKYLVDISREKLISTDEEVELAQKIHKGDQRALNKLVRANLRFVVSVAKQYQNQGLSLNDLVNEGNIGLVKAAQKFDETRGFKFMDSPKHFAGNLRAEPHCAYAAESGGFSKQTFQSHCEF